MIMLIMKLEEEKGVHMCRREERKMGKIKWVIAVLCMFVLSGCGSVTNANGAEDIQKEDSRKGEDAMQEWVMVQATVDKIEGPNLCVQTTKNDNFPSAYMRLPASYLGEENQAQVGTVLEISCDGLVFETYPAQFGKINYVKIISRPDEDNANDTSQSEGDNAVDGKDKSVTWQKIEVAPQEGSLCTISFMLPENWDYSWSQSEDIPVSCISIGIYPKAEGDMDGNIIIEYAEGFGVCGTGLASEETTFNGHAAHVGTYDNHPYWDFISLDSPYDGCVILNGAGHSWFEKYKDELSQILATVEFTMCDE